MDKVPSILETLNAVAQVKSEVKVSWQKMDSVTRRRVWLNLQQMRNDIRGGVVDGSS